MRRNPVPKATAEPLAPNRETNPLPAKCDSSRRRFLRPLAGGTGVCVVGLPRLVHGQSLIVDLTKLDRHRPVDALLPLEVMEADDDADDVLAGLEEEQVVDTESGVPMHMDNPPPVPGGPASIVESRALWVEPGYLILVRWSRPETDESCITALEGAADTLAEFLDARVTNVDHIHNLDQLHELEWELVEQLNPIVTPATIEVLHLDHDCTQVCSVLDPSYAYPEIYELEGDVAPVYWE